MSRQRKRFNAKFKSDLVIELFVAAFIAGIGKPKWAEVVIITPLIARIQKILHQQKLKIRKVTPNSVISLNYSTEVSLNV